MADSDHPKIAAPAHDVHELIRQRWSPRAFDATRTVPRAELLRLFEAARWAPSSWNEQPWRFVVVARDETSEAWKAAVESLTPSNRSWAAAAPFLAIVAVRLTLERNESPNPLAWYDAGQAVALLTMQATAQGLSIRQMEGFDQQHVRRACGIPDGFDPIVVIAIGFAGDPDTLALDKHRASERQPRRRRELGDFVYEGKWGTKIDLGSRFPD